MRNAQPSQVSRIIAALKHGTAVTVRDSVTRDGQKWYHVEARTASGWVEADYISPEPP